MRLGIQLYSIRDVEDPLPEVVERVGDTAFEGVEFAGLEDAAGVASALDGAGVTPAGAHVGLDALEEEFEATVDTYRTVGCRDLAVPWLGPEHFESEESVAAIAERLSAAAADLGDRDLRLHYHNHDQAFTDLGDRTALEALVEATDDVGFEFDLGWVGMAGHDPIELFEEYADRCTLVHVKDYHEDTGEEAEAGEGDLDLEAVAEIGDDAGVEWAIYEYEGRPDSYETLDNGAAALEPYF